MSSIELKIRNVLKSNGIMTEVFEIKVKDAGLQGEGMVSETKFITVKFCQKSSANVEPLNLFAKVHFCNESQIEMVMEIKAFEKEATFYMEYVPAARGLCDLKGHPGLIDFYPKCYYADKEITIFQNIAHDMGFTLVEKQKLQDYEESKAALTTLAKHHAISYAVVQEHGGADVFFERFKFLNFEPYVTESGKSMIEPMLENGVEMCINLLQRNNVQRKEDTISVLTSLKEKTFSILLECLNEHQSNEILVLNHGDYWNNNMMFLKDPDTNEVKGHMAIDFQTTRYGSPALDLGFYVFTSIQPNVRRAHLKELLRVYLNVLKTTSNDLGYPINMSFDELFHLFRRKFKVGFCFGLAVSTGPGYAALQDYKTEEFGDISNWAGYFDMLMQKWIDKNPEKGEAMAQNIVEVMLDEYQQLTL